MLSKEQFLELKTDNCWWRGQEGSSSNPIFDSFKRPCFGGGDGGGSGGMFALVFLAGVSPLRHFHNHHF